MRKLASATLLGRHTAGVTCVRISPSDGRIYSSSLDGTVRVWDSSKPLISFRKVRLYPRSPVVPVWATTLAINSEYLVCGLHNGLVHLFSPATGRLIRKLPNPPERSAYRYNFHTVATHPKNPEIIAGSNGGYLVVWSATSGKILWRETSFRLINTVLFLRQGQILMAHEWDPWLHLWYFETRKRRPFDSSIMETSANWVTACASPPRSKLDFVIATEDAHESRLIGVNLDHPDPLWQAPAPARVRDLCFLPDGRYLLTGDESGGLLLWDTESNQTPLASNLRQEAVVQGEFPAESVRQPGLIHTTPTLDEKFDPPWTIHSLDVAPHPSFGVLGLANGTVLRVDLAT